MATSPGTERALRARFGRILMSDPCQTIDFYWGPLHVDGSAFSYIALALASTPPKGIRCNVGGVPAGSDAIYDPPTNTISVPRDSFASTDFSEKMAIVHEATHAIADATMAGTSMRGELEETAAYVADALFNIYSAPDYVPYEPDDPYAPDDDPYAPDPSYPFDPAGRGLFETAHNVALQIANSRGSKLDPNVASPLRLAILADPNYSFLKTSPRYFRSGVSL